jgi:putative chitinase
MTPSQLAQCTGAKLDVAAKWFPYITAAMAEFGIDTPQRKAMFLAQIGHESGSLRFTEEIWGPTAAQNTYEGRVNLGNTVQGDGYRFRGRGLVQTTGRFNYTKTGEALGLDLISYPELLQEPAAAARSAAWFWQSHGCNAFADADDNVSWTKRINGGFNGLDDRRKRYAAAKAAIVYMAEQTEPNAAPAAPVAASAAGFVAFLLGLVKMFLRKKP